MQKFFLRLGLTLAACIVSAVTAVVGTGFLTAALYLAIRDVTSPTIAALAVGGAAFVFTGLIVLFAAVALRPRGVTAKTDDKPCGGGAQPEIAAEIGMLIGSQSMAWIRDHAKSATVVALAVGFVVGANPKFRETLRNVVKPPR